MRLPSLSLPTALCPPPPLHNHHRSNLLHPFNLRAAASVTASSDHHVVVTRESGKNDILIKALAKHEINCLELPLLQYTRLPEPERLPTMLNYTTYDWIIITSPEAASFFLEGWKAAGAPCVRVAAMGDGIRSKFEEAIGYKQFIEVSFSPSRASAKVLVAELPKNGNGSCSVFYPASAKASHDIEEGLSKRGFTVWRLNTYTTEPVQHVDPITLEQALSAPVVALASTSAVRAWVNLLPDPEQWGGSVACIGETTALTAKQLGLRNVYHPSKPGLRGWVNDIIGALHDCKSIQKV